MYVEVFETSRPEPGPSAGLLKGFGFEHASPLHSVDLFAYYGGVMRAISREIFEVRHCR